MKYRVPLILVLIGLTAYMGYRAREVTLSYDLATIVPSDDPEMMTYQEFKDLFGEDGNVMVVGVQDSSLFELENFTRFKYMTDEYSRLRGVSEVLSIATLQRVEKEKDEEGKNVFNVRPVFKDIPRTQEELDSILQVVRDQKFYSGQILNESNGATVILLAIDKDVLRSEYRLTLVQDIQDLGDKFMEVTGIDIHYSGLPFVRSVTAKTVQKEMTTFLIISLIITAVILLIFFRSFTAVIFPMILIGMVVIWVMGTIAIFNFQITILTGLIPPIIVVIGIPNCIYLLNKYHHEYSLHGNKALALSRIIRKIGLVTLITNFTTAVGFGVLISTDIMILKEFGIVAALNIMATFVISIILLPGGLSFLPGPSLRQMKHLQLTPLDKVLTWLDLLVHRHRTQIYVVTATLLLVSLVGVYKIQSVSYMVDDIPEDSRVKKDLRFFERNFSGVMPLEILIDTGKKKGVMKLKNLRKIDSFEKDVAEQPDFSKPISVVSFVKALKQAYYNNNPKYYDLPNNREKAFVLRGLRKEDNEGGLLRSFVDSTGQVLRVSIKIADLGSIKMDSLVHEVIEPQAQEIFGESDLKATVTGTTLIFIKGNKFLVENLRFSMMLAFLIIAVIMGILFQNFRMILISLIPNFIPLILTAGIMGWFGIPLKPSTALVFSIAFGISVDDSIHFLAKYRQELFANRFFVPYAVSKSIRETGPSMMYTSIVLFFGFFVFTGSSFLGTVALGLLTSITLLIAMFTNLIVLPALLLTFDDGKRKTDAHPLIEHYDEFYSEDEDEEIELELIELQQNGISDKEIPSTEEEKN